MSEQVEVDLGELREEGRLYFKCSKCGWEGKSSNKLHVAGLCPRCENKTLDIIGIIDYLDDPIGAPE